MRVLTTAATLVMGLTASADAATMGYLWATDDWSMSMFIETQPGEDFFDLINDPLPSWRLGSEAMELLGSMGTYFGVGPDDVGGEIYRDKIGEEFEVAGGTCFVDVHHIYGSTISFATGDLTHSYHYSVRGWYPETDGADCSSVNQSYSVFDDPIGGFWKAVGGAPAYPFKEPETPAPVPLPASAALLGLALTGLGVAARRRSSRPGTAA